MVKRFQSLAAEIVTAARLPVRFRAYLIEGLKTGSAVCVQSLAYGKPCIQILPAKWCTPTRDASGCIVRLVIQYKHPDTQGVLCVYRREIGGGFDRAYQTVPASRLVDAGFEWSTVPIASEVPIAFVPVVWTRSMCEAVEEGSSIDGNALAQGLEDELDAISMAELLREMAEAAHERRRRAAEAKREAEERAREEAEACRRVEEALEKARVEEIEAAPTAYAGFRWGSSFDDPRLLSAGDAPDPPRIVELDND